MTRMLDRRISGSLVLVLALFSPSTPSAETKSASKFEELTHDAKANGASVIVLQIWGEHCSHCVAEMPALNEFAEKLKTIPEATLVGLAIPSGHKSEKESLSAIEALVKKHKLAYPNFAWLGSGDALVEHFNLTGTPQTVLLDADGEILQQIEVPKDPAKIPDALLAVVNNAIKKHEKK